MRGKTISRECLELNGAPGMYLDSEKGQHDTQLPFWFGLACPEQASHIPHLANESYQTPYKSQSIYLCLCVSVLTFLDSAFINSHTFCCCKEYKKQF